MSRNMFDASRVWIDSFLSWATSLVQSQEKQTQLIFLSYVRSFAEAWLSGALSVPVSPSDQEILFSTGMVSPYTREIPIQTPFAVHENRFSTNRLLSDEQMVFQEWEERCVWDPLLSSDEGYALVRDIFSDEDWTDQMQAVYTCLFLPCVLVTGGPGTGKTTTLIRILMSLFLLNPDASLALCAPTGKAAMNLMAVLHKEKAIFVEKKLSEKALSTLFSSKAQTIHRLLNFPHHETCQGPLPFDIVVVDESSMLDLSLLKHLMKRSKKGARLIFLGDSNQLSPVQGSAVFHSLVSFLSSPKTGENACSDVLSPVVFLKKNYRFSSSALPECARLVLTEDEPCISSFIQNNPSQFSFWDPDACSSDDFWTRIALGYERYGEALRCCAPIDVLFTQLSLFRVLCAVTQGSHGVNEANKNLSRFWGYSLSAVKRGGFFPGTPIMVSVNHASKDLYNGDIGIFYWCQNHPGVFFPTLDGFRFILWEEMPPHEAAWATTVHKAQGSEFSSIALMSPPGYQIKTFNREWLYTAITRAKNHVLLCFSCEQLKKILL